MLVVLSYFNISPHTPSFILTALRPWWGQVHFWAQCKQTSLWGFDDRPSSDHFYHPGVPVASYLWLWARWKHVHFLPRCQGQELCRRVLQHSHTRSNQVFSLRCSILLSCCFSSSCMAPFFLSCTSLLDSSSLGLELVNNMPYVKNILTEWQFAWKRSKQRLVRMGVVWEWGIIWLPSSLCYILSKICFSGGRVTKWHDTLTSKALKVTLEPGFQAMWVCAIAVEAVMEKCGLWGKAGPASWHLVD